LIADCESSRSRLAIAPFDDCLAYAVDDAPFISDGIMEPKDQTNEVWEGNSQPSPDGGTVNKFTLAAARSSQAFALKSQT
jgi:hypothetical protein